MSKDDLKKIEKKFIADLNQADLLIKKSAEFSSRLDYKVQESVSKNNKANQEIDNELEKISDKLDKGFLEVIFNTPSKD